MKPKLKLLHTADLHLGASFLGLGERGAEQRRRLREVLQDIVRAALDEKVDAVLLAGDVFDNLRPSPESLEAFHAAIRQLAAVQIPAVMIAGTHDHLGDNHFLPELAAQHAGTLILLTPENPVWEHPGRNLLVQGISLLAADSPERPLAGLRRMPGTAWQIGLAHAALEMGKTGQREASFSMAEIAATELDYLALGHWHGMRDCSHGQVAAWYSGAPEMIALDEAQSGFVLLIGLEEGKPAQVSPLRVGKRTCLRLETDVASEDKEKLLTRIQAAANPDTVLEVVLTGIAPAGLAVQPEELRRELAPHFFQVRVRDASTTTLSQTELDRFPETTIAGRYLRLVQSEMAGADEGRRQELSQALQLGLAMLSGREVKLWS